ncbi:hypothetical protein THAOC_13274 [Thalassiosira oceanica]|uniref:Uncharacterized protein n=1 Tax=Thalassiosira oceanica TaxID=159749 RepID=K0SLI2_THAOC|nr:hypothetical protein THAOC_13274 [Thalassiosira oceanica]|eukprot:EJK65829.1 hypothetical protein THAOC_13274 [Thalassiosira oceanica]
MGAHVRGRKLEEIDLKAEVPDVAGVHRHRALQLDVSDPTCQFQFGFGNPGPLSNATSIGPCAPPGNQSQCPHHEPCVPTYLQEDATGPSTYTEFEPNYQVSSLSAILEFGPLPGSNIINIKTLPVWSGCHRDRTDANPVALALSILQGLKFVPNIIEAVCEAMDDDIEICVGAGLGACVCVACVDLPSPPHVICTAGKAVAEVFVKEMEVFYNKVNYQDQLVDSAEIEAAYEHSRNLLHKQCAIYDQVTKRCSVNLGIRSGCDGMDNDNDDLIDECDEDTVPPTIRTDAAARCSEVWFATENEALECVKSTTIIEDDCHNTTVPAFVVTNSCGNSTVDITVQDGCGNEATTSVQGRVATEVTWIESGGPGLMKDPSFYYLAVDSCGEPLHVTVDFYSNEFENRNNFALNENHVRFYQNGNPNDRAGVYLAMAMCDPGNSWICINDPTAENARLYTAKVSAVDSTGFEASTECKLRVIPKGVLDGMAIDTSQSTQQFHVASYTSTF